MAKMACVKGLGLSSLAFTFYFLSLFLWMSSTKAEVCSTKMNVVFAVDGSHKMGKNNFDLIVNFIFNVSNNFDVSVNKTWIITVLGNETTVYKTQEELDNYTTPSFPNSSQVFLGQTLGLVMQSLSENDTQRDASNVVVLIATHTSDDDIAIPAVRLKASNATTFVAGIGDQFSFGQLKEIASNPDDQHFIEANDTIDLLKRFSTPLANKICQVVDRCVSSPCHNNGKCTSIPGGYSCDCLPEFNGDNCEKSKSVEYKYLGCYRDDNITSVIPSIESVNATYLDGNFTTRTGPIKKCALEAAKMGYRVFALQGHGACHSGPHAHLNYSILGFWDCGVEGLGGVLGNDVYLLGAKCGNLLNDGLIHLSSATIHGSSINESWEVPLLDGNLYSWCPKDNDLTPKLEIDLGREAFLTELSLQGRKDSRDYPDNYCFASAVGGGEDEQILRNFTTCLVHLSTVSSNSKTPVRIMSASGFQYLNFAPWRPFKGDGMCLRIDIFDNNDESNLRSGNLVTYNYTSVRGNFTGAPLIDGNVSWCPDDDDFLFNPVLKVDLGFPLNNTKVEVQGAKDAKEWPYKFCLSVSLDGSRFFQVDTRESSCLLFEQTNNDRNGNEVRTRQLSPARLVQSVSLQPRYATYGTQDAYCIRTELEGCITTTVEGEIVTDGCSHRTKKDKCCVLPYLYEGRMVYSCIRDNHNQPWCATTDNYDRDMLWDNCQEASSRPCHAMSCLNGGTCEEDLVEWSFKCKCSDRFLGDRCEDDFDECHNSLCQNGGTCVNTYGDYRCECNHGYSGKNCHLDCMFSEIELGFLVDGSASVKFYGEDNFHLIKEAIKSFVRSFNVSSAKTRVGVVVYSTNSTVAFTLNQYSSVGDIEEAIDNITYPSGGTYTGQALNDAANILFSNETVRGNVSKALVVITDGVSTDDVTGPAALVNETGVNTYVIGIGQNVDRPQLLQIAHNVPDHLFQAEFNSLQMAFNGVRETICLALDKCADNPCRFGGVCKNEGMNCSCSEGFRGPKCSEDIKECSNVSVNCTTEKLCTETFGGYECTCANMSLYGDNCTKACSDESTVLFLLDRAKNVGEDNVKRQVEFIISVASTIPFKNIAVISYATDAEIVIRPGQSSNFSEFAETLRNANYSVGHTKNLGKALEKAQEITEIYNHSTPALVVAMILGKSDDDHSDNAAKLKQLGVTIVAMTLDDSYSIPQLFPLTSDPLNDHWLNTNVASLKHFISNTRNIICQAWNPCSNAVCAPLHECRNNYGTHGGFRCIPPPSLCEPNPCKNGGNCIITANDTFNCTCPPGIGGVTCTEDILDECSTAPCKNGGTCFDRLGSFLCICTKQFNGAQCEVDCSIQRLNLVFLVDGSGSIEIQGQGNFQRSKDFITNLIDSFDVGRDQVNIATVLYWHSYRIIHRLDTYYSKENIVRAIQGMSYPNGGTRTGQGLTVIRTQILSNVEASRDQLPKVVVVLTDGLSADNVAVPAQALHNMGVTVVVVGVGCCFYRPELNVMASDPDQDHVYEVTFTDLQKITPLLREQICVDSLDFCASQPCQNGGNCTSLADDFQCSCLSGWTGKDCSNDTDECATNVTKCPDNQVCHNYPGESTCLCKDNRYGNNCTIQCNYTKVDVGFLVDSSGSINTADSLNYQRIKDFIKGFIRSVIIGENDTRIGFATFSGENTFTVRISFTDFFNTDPLINAVEMIPYDSGGTRTGEALDRIRTDLFSMAREGLPHILVVLTDGKSQDSVTAPSRLLRQMGVQIISVGVGDAVYEELADMASEPDSENIYDVTFESLSNLTGSLLDSVCKAAEPCKRQPCRNGGTCHGSGGTFRCECPLGITGPTCEIDIDECSPTSPCTNATKICINFPGTHFCNCKPGNYEIQNNCTGEYADIFNIAFVIYTGESIDQYNKGNFAKQIEFVKGLSKTFNVTKDETNVGIITYAGDAVVRYRFENITNQTELETALDTITINGSGRNIGKALDVVQTDLFNEEIPGRNVSVRDILIVITDGASDDNISVPAIALKEDGAIIFSLGIDRYVRGELNEMASDPDSEHVFTIDDYDGLGPTMALLKDAIIGDSVEDPCQRQPCKNGGTCNITEQTFKCECPLGLMGPTCEIDIDECLNNPCINNAVSCKNTFGSYECNCRPDFTGRHCEAAILSSVFDVVFVFDGSSHITYSVFQQTLLLAKSVISSYSISQDETNVAAAVYPRDVNVSFAFSDHYSFSAVSSAIDSIPYLNQTSLNMSAALETVNDTIFPSGRGVCPMSACYLRQ